MTKKFRFPFLFCNRNWHQTYPRLSLRLDTKIYGWFIDPSPLTDWRGHLSQEKYRKKQGVFQHEKIENLSSFVKRCDDSKQIFPDVKFADVSFADGYLQRKRAYWKDLRGLKVANQKFRMWIWKIWHSADVILADQSWRMPHSRMRIHRKFHVLILV